uniref:Uncharacterized protein n=1 Tax=Ditylenchus dipsaci TaxID=166011 RepID=A0A915DQ91_9BILA
MLSRFIGKVAIVTGSSSGIGREAAIGFAKEGACVVVHGQNAEELKNTESMMLEADCCKFGKIDVLVNNAGAASKPRETATSKLIADSLDNFDYLFHLNVRSAVEMTLLALPYLEKTKGNIINVGSVGSTKTFPTSTFYSCTKAALDHFTRNYADKLGVQGIRVNSLNPGSIKTNVVARHNLRNGQEKFEQFAAGHTSLGRIGEVSEVAPILLFLASEQASYVTGATWVVDGGMLVRAL